MPGYWERFLANGLLGGSVTGADFLPTPAYIANRWFTTFPQYPTPLDYFTGYFAFMLWGSPMYVTRATRINGLQFWTIPGNLFPDNVLSAAIYYPNDLNPMGPHKLHAECGLLARDVGASDFGSCSFSPLALDAGWHLVVLGRLTTGATGAIGSFTDGNFNGINVFGNAHGSPGQPKNGLITNAEYVKFPDFLTFKGYTSHGAIGLMRGA